MLEACYMSPSHCHLQKAVYIKSYKTDRIENALSSLISPPNPYENSNRDFWSLREIKNIYPKMLWCCNPLSAIAHRTFFFLTIPLLARCLLSFVQRQTFFPILTRESKENQVNTYVNSQLLFFQESSDNNLKTDHLFYTEALI